MRTFGPASALSLVATLLASIAAIVGATWPGVYRDEGIILDGWFPNDLVTLLVAVPVLLVARARAVQGSRRAELVWLGTLHYLVYNGAFYLLGAKLNWLFPLYAAMVIAALWALVRLAARIDAAAHAEAAASRGPTRAVAAWMVFVALGLGGIWSAQWLVAMLRTSAPTRFDVTPDFIRLVAALDLSLMVAFFVPGAVWLWRRRPWGFVLGVAMNVSAALYNVVLFGGSLVQLRAGLPGAGPMLGLWAVLAVGSALSAQRLLAAMTPRA